MIFLLTLISSIAFGAVSTADRALVERGNNLLTNGGFESGKAAWTASGGTFTVTQTAASVGKGLVAGSFDSGSAGQTLTSAAVSIPGGLLGRNGVASCMFKGSGNTYKLQAYDGSNVLNEVTINSQAGYATTSVNFIFPSSGSIQLRLVSVASDEPAVLIDDCYLGDAEGFNLANISQASFVGSIEWTETANCSWERTNGSFGSFSNDNDCDDNARTVVGNISDSSAGLRPEFTILNAKNGNYMAVLSGSIDAISTGASTDVTADFILHDGTSQISEINKVRFSGASGSLVSANPNMVFNFPVSTSGNKVINVQARTSGTNPAARIRPVNSTFKISVYYFPSGTDTIYNANTTPAFGWARWVGGSGKSHDVSSGSYTTFTNANFATRTNNGIVVNPANTNNIEISAQLPSGKYLVEWSGAEIRNTYTSSNTSCSYRIFDGTNSSAISTLLTVSASTVSNGNYVSGVFEYDSYGSRTFSLQAVRNSGGGVCSIYLTETNSSAEFRIIPLSQNLPAPQLVGSVTSNTSGLERIERISVTNSGTPTIARQSGTWVTSLGASGVGDIAVTVASGIFSDLPSCTCTSSYADSNTRCGLTVNSATSISVNTRNVQTNTQADVNFDLICMGSRGN
jgi:hypothetical protein